MSRRDRKRDNLKRTALASGLAAAAGYLAGILTAPKSGRETRDDILDAADKGRDQAEKDLGRLQAELDKTLKEAKTRGGKLSAKAEEELRELADKANDSRQKAGELLSAVRAGDAEDKDLAKAVKNANAALKHLRDYLKK